LNNEDKVSVNPTAEEAENRNQLPVRYRRRKKIGIWKYIKLQTTKTQKIQVGTEK